MSAYDAIFRRSEGVLDEFVNLMIGDMIGEGAFRKVYECKLDPSLVVKIENTANREFPNVHEWAIWQEVEFHDILSKWYAPCVQISHSGSVLLQKRTKPLRKMPEMVPELFADVKRENFGLYQGRPVMHDYGNHSFYDIAKRKFRMVHASTC